MLGLGDLLRGFLRRLAGPARAVFLGHVQAANQGIQAALQFEVGLRRVPSACVDPLVVCDEPAALMLIHIEPRESLFQQPAVFRAHDMFQRGMEVGLELGTGLFETGPGLLPFLAGIRDQGIGEGVLGLDQAGSRVLEMDDAGQHPLVEDLAFLLDDGHAPDQLQPDDQDHQHAQAESHHQSRGQRQAFEFAQNHA